MRLRRFPLHRDSQPGSPLPRWLCLLACLGMVGCAAAEPPPARLAGLLLDAELDEISGLAASRRHDNLLWLIEDGGNPARLHAVSRRGRKRATFALAGATTTDWEDLAAFELDGRAYLLVADTGDNGGLRRTLQLHVVAEPSRLSGGILKPAWSIAFRWPDGARDCEAVAVDAARGQILLISKKRQPPELFVLPLRPRSPSVHTARALGRLLRAPRADADEQRVDPARARIHSQVTAADLSPDGRTLAVLTYRQVLLYSRRGNEPWASAIARTPERRALPWLHQAEALGWAAHGRGLYATGEFSPAPLLYLPADPAAE
ncbi:MAG: hypothetical protein LC715_01330 [Gammaproteobacteria bacterium]|nr:hypothetical protein [Gammaproteobacteria bacterium]